MDYMKADELNKKWKEENPNKECPHPSFQKEVLFGTSTGDKICNECYEVFSPNRLAELRGK
ncbi:MULTISPECIES: hypothetical protein [Bacillus cereus group]|uniref:Uncharacterized protein n=2 Tax=Bacillus cereus group TaxID=86661 RepID=A0A9X7AS78_BACTU|nr:MULTISPECIES: hypothetical protein [Bacillus cereus group]EKS7858056.1 hypothetical protein [Bacillus cereus]EOO11409.1 hypothetical protein IGA_05672 [Bacillus cereus HuA3-9]PEV64180.1 hypothetical protein CN434_25565 [Bacillus thuringiensis]PFT50794.1 hypothetical protein COK72_01965 [Bacillus thuringiensis]PFY22831.1 hypothetical protein COL44_18285 [Bacillus toyonensis]